MQLNKYFLFLTIFLNQVLLGGFDPNTWVQTPKGRELISRLQRDDLVMCRKDNKLFERRVRGQQAQRQKAGWRVELHNEVIQASADQRFYSVRNGQWKKAQDLEAGELLLTSNNEEVVVQRAYAIDEEIDLNQIEVDDCHNYFASKTGVLVHNEPFTIGLGVSFAFGAGAPEAVCITGSLLLGAIGIKMASDVNSKHTVEPFIDVDKLNEEIAALNDNKTKSSSDSKEKAASEKDKKDEKGGSGGEKDPKKDDKDGDKKEGVVVPPPVSSGEKDKSSAGSGTAAKGQEATPVQPNGKFQGADYHHADSKGGGNGGKSPAPKDGQKALDNSVLVKEKGNNGTQRRVAAVDDQFVVLDQTVKNEFHAHTRSWNELDQKMKTALQDNGITNHKGKIL